QPWPCHLSAHAKTWKSPRWSRNRPRESDGTGAASPWHPAWMARVVMPLPDHDFDTTEIAVPWRVMRAAGIDVVFATEHGAAGETDPRLLTGVVLGKLGASPDTIATYRDLQSDPAYAQPIAYADIEPADYDGVVLPGGHAPG